jgi:hypothetical protein|tara:strand:- start:1542 stop:1799 length:258 start_codon:yes stop_codon:yes gene_type:complete
MTGKKPYKVGTLVIRREKYQSWLENEPVEIIGVVVEKKKMRWVSHLISYGFHYRIQWNDGSESLFEDKVLDAHLKSGYITMLSEG